MNEFSSFSNSVSPDTGVTRMTLPAPAFQAPRLKTMSGVSRRSCTHDVRMHLSPTRAGVGGVGGAVVVGVSGMDRCAGANEVVVSERRLPGADASEGVREDIKDQEERNCICV
jgi:hypothetical protein